MAASRQLPFKSRMSAEARRAVIERVAAEAFAQKGYDGVSVDEIAVAAGITKATLYDHFDSKQDLYVHLLGHSAQQMLQFMADRIEALDSDGPEARLRESLDAFFEFVETSPFSWRMLFRKPPIDPDLTAGAGLVQDGATANIANLLRSLSPAAEKIPEQRMLLLAEALKWTQNGLAVWWYDHPDVPREEVVESVMSLSWPGLRLLLTEAALVRYPPAPEGGLPGQRGRIIEAAIEVFAKRGYLSTTTGHILAAAEIEAQTFDELFDGPQDCLLQAYDRIVEESSSRISEAIPLEGDWPEQICAALRALLGLIAEQPHRARVALVEVQTGGASALAHYEHTLDSLAPYLGRGREFSSIADQLPATLDIAVLGGLAWFLQRRVVRGELEDIEQLLPDLLERAVEPYLGERDASMRIAVALKALP
jgi:AcrR family transcriptional regulator